MGLVRFGIGIAEISGSAGGMVFAKNKSGAYIRNRTKPVNPHTARQESSRAIVSYLAEYWHTELTAVQRNLWEVYAAAVAMKNRLGETIHLSGFNMFIRSNSAQKCMGETELAAAPTILSLPEKDPDLVCSEEAIAAQTFTFTCDTSGFVANGDPKFGIMIAQGQPQLASRQTFHGPWRYMDFIDATEGAAGTATLAAAFAFALGQKVWFRARIITDSLRLSEPWTVDARVIEADP